MSTANGSRWFDIAVIGGGIVGTATAMALLEREPDLSLVVLEKENRLAQHQTGRNSGVIHSGLYYHPGSLKAQTCIAGREALYRFCADHDLPFERCGKVVVAVDEAEIPGLDLLEKRGRENGLKGLERLDEQQLREFEPHVRGVAGLHVPDTGIVDFVAVTEAFAARIRKLGGEVHVGAGVRWMLRRKGDFLFDTPLGSFRAARVINCAGLQCDRVARMFHHEPGVRIVPFRGEYFQLSPERGDLVRNLIYPVPDPDLPFLGVHFTRMITGEIEAGPNAVLAFKREGYDPFNFSFQDTWETITYPGFWKLAARLRRSGLREYRRSVNKGLFVWDLQRLVPDIKASDVVPGKVGVRAQAVDPEGRLVDDFHIEEGDGTIHVLNAPSPAATASISIGQTIAQKADQLFRLTF